MSKQGIAQSFDERDEYLRRPIAEKIIRLLASNIKISPLVIDGSWGAGKTEFCEKLKDLVNKHEKPKFYSVYVDAFRADHADQPLMTLLAAVLSQIPEKEKSQLIEKALPALRFGLKLTGKAAVSWLLKQDAATLGKDFKEDVVQAISESIINKTVETMLDDHMKVEESIGALQNILSKIAKEKPIVLFIDELDCCRPDFAVAMLEVIKHVFDVADVQIVLVTNTQQLKASINHCYGSGVDSQRYLDKFISFSFYLPTKFKKPGDHVAIQTAQEHFRKQIENSSHLNESELIKQGGGLINELIKSRQLSLREVETLVRYLEIYQELTEDKESANNIPYGRLCSRIYAIYCSCFFPDLAQQLLTNKYSPEAIADSLGQESKLAELDEYSNPSSLEFLIALLSLDHPESANDLKCDEAQKSRWRKKLSGAFGNHGCQPETQEERIEIIQQTIQTLTLVT